VKRTPTLVLAALVAAASLVPLVRAQQAQPSAPPEDPLLAGFRRSTVASVSDAVDQVVGRRGFLTHEIRPMVAGSTGTIVGRARTALVKPAPPERATPPLAVKHSVEMIDSGGPGEVGVIVMENGLDVAAMGGLMGTAAKARGMEGMVLDGGVRDLAELRALNLPVYARSVTPATAVGRFASVARDVPVECGGVTIRPGDIVVAGEDGVVVVPQEKAADVLKRSQEIDERETKMVPFIKQQRSLQKVIELFNRI
jgi:regulator of RNase E activity RraA